MGHSGAPTPDELLPQTYRCVKIYVPDCVGDLFFSYVMGQLGEMTQDWYWKQEGTLTPEQSAFLMATAMAMTDADGLDCEETMTCQDLADCIDTNTVVQTSINNTIVETGQISPNVTNVNQAEINFRFPAPQRQEDVSVPPPACNKDALWTGIYEIVSRLDEMCRDFYEDIVAANDKVQRAAIIIGGVPLFGDTLAASINLFGEVAPDILNGYNSHSSITVLEDVSCDLFEMVCQDCRYPTYDELYEYFANFGISGIQDIAAYGVQAAIDALIGTNGLASAVVWHSSIAIGLYIMYMGGNYLNYRGTKWLAIWADIGEDNPNNGWQLLCNGCQDTWCYQWDGTALADGWAVTQGIVDATGVKVNLYNDGNDQHNGATITLNAIPSGVNRVELSAHGNGWWSQNSMALYRLRFYYDDATFNTANLVKGINSQGGAWTETPFLEAQAGKTITSIEVLINTNFKQDGNITVTLFDGWIDSVRLLGDGANPYGLDNCP